MTDYRPPAIFAALPRRFAPLPSAEIKPQPAHSAAELALVQRVPSGAAAFPGVLSPGEVAAKQRIQSAKAAAQGASTKRARRAVTPPPRPSVRATRRAAQDEVLLTRMRADPGRQWTATALVAGTHIRSHNVRQFVARQAALVEYVMSASGQSRLVRLRPGAAP